MYYTKGRSLDVSITIHVKNDEWYYIKIVKDNPLYDRSYTSTNFYRCDQFDGLLKCMEDKI